MSEIRVRLDHSTIGCPPDQRATVLGLGLRRIRHERVLKDTPCVRGMVHKVSHLVSICELGTATKKKTAVKTKTKKGKTDAAK